MAGELTPVVMIPRYSAYSSGTTSPATQEYATIAMDTTPYETAVLSVWRAKLIGTDTPAFKIFFEESTDQVTWATCDGTSGSGEDPGDATEVQYTASLKRRWFRVRVKLAGTNPVATCWCVGFLVERIR